jgi:hypothetical protein
MSIYSLLSQDDGRSHGAFFGARSGGLSAQMPCHSYRTDTYPEIYALFVCVGQGLVRGETVQECGSLATHICRDDGGMGFCCEEGLLAHL